MTATTRSDGLFKDPHVVGKFISLKVGGVRSARITRDGMVITECSSKCQRDRALNSVAFED